MPKMVYLATHMRAWASWPMIRENRQLVTDGPVEFKKQLVEVQDCRKITDHFRGIYRIYSNLDERTLVNRIPF